MKVFKVGVCCTFGVGSSMILKGNLETVFQKIGANAEIEISDIANVATGGFDFVFTSKALVEQVVSLVPAEMKIVPVIDYFNMKQLEEDALQAMGEVK